MNQAPLAAIYFGALEKLLRRAGDDLSCTRNFHAIR